MRLSTPRLAMILTVGAILAVAIPLVAARTMGGLATPGTWTTIADYTFHGRAGTGIDPSQWSYDTGQGIFGTGEVHDMTTSVANVHRTGQGTLAITALQGGTWTSGRIRTRNNTFAAPAGGELSVSASIMQPDGPGPGYWPAFWMLGPGRWPQDGEIDIMEDVDSVSKHSAALHCGNLSAVNPDGTTGPCHEHTGLSSGLQPCPACQTGYHVYSVTIDRRDTSDEQIRWSVDGQQFFSVSESRVGPAAWTRAVDHGFSIILDLAIGGNYPDSVCRCTAPTTATVPGGTMSVKYVSVQEWRPLLGL
jgi:beta-glucanase (GH16 family)